ncbi:hypothetical protein F5Y17DRAFT_463274 [Xylariaceae sp. FL0594]|nr:hypothetical protein F5Y17DRAFT_463274 [Xylariaceae sp. FL0594]
MASYPDANEPASADVAISSLTEAQALPQQGTGDQQQHQHHGLPDPHQLELEHTQQQHSTEQLVDLSHGHEQHTNGNNGNEGVSQHHQPLTHNHHSPHQQPQHEPSATPTPPPHNHELTLNQVHTTEIHHTTTTLTHTELYDGSLLSSVPVTAVAHHGLQVLQAASAAPMSPTSNDLARQYAQSAALQMGEPQFSPPPMSNHGLGQVNGNGSQKVTRLRRACDMCSQRKVKCDESGPPCKPCSDLDVDCTFRREMKRRGPPNKHAEAAKASKRHHMEMSPMPQTAADALVSATMSPRSLNLDAESIAPWPVLQLLVDDFFTYIHPLTPFPHQPNFRQAFMARADRTNREFLALLASMVGALVASFPRSARAHLKAQHSAGLFPSAVTMVDHCRSIALEARGTSFMAKEEMSVDDAATSYFLALAAGYTLQWKLFRRFFAETQSFCRELGIHRSQDVANLASHSNVINAATSKPIDHIKDQIGKRIFWVMVASIRSMTQLGASINELPLPPPTTQEPYPDLPVEVDDEYIFPDQILPQPEGTISLITGFNINTRIYMTMSELVGVQMCYGINFFNWQAKKNILGNGLTHTKEAIADLPSQLQIAKSEPVQDDPAELDRAGLQYCPPAFAESQPANDVRRTLMEQPLRRRQLQCEIQKANIHGSQLATRSYFVERYLSLPDVDPAVEKHLQVKHDMDDMVAQERESIVHDLLAVLASVSQRNIEPNGQSTINKIRQVASTLIQSDSERKGPLAVKAEEYLQKFLEVLVRLERSGAAAVVGVNSGTMGTQDEEEELRNWASLRDCQVEFVKLGGFLGDQL